MNSIFLTQIRSQNLAIHIFSASICLVVFVLVNFFEKGTLRHKNLGKIFAVSAILTVVTSLIGSYLLLMFSELFVLSKVHLGIIQNSVGLTILSFLCCLNAIASILKYNKKNTHGNLHIIIRIVNVVFLFLAVFCYKHLWEKKIYLGFALEMFRIFLIPMSWYYFLKSKKDLIFFHKLNFFNFGILLFESMIVGGASRYFLPFLTNAQRTVVYNIAFLIYFVQQFYSYNKNKAIPRQVNKQC